MEDLKRLIALSVNCTIDLVSTNNTNTHLNWKCAKWRNQHKLHTCIKIARWEIHGEYTGKNLAGTMLVLASNVWKTAY